MRGACGDNATEDKQQQQTPVTTQQVSVHDTVLSVGPEGLVGSALVATGYSGNL